MNSSTADRASKPPLETPADHVRVLHAQARTGAVAVATRFGEARRWRERAMVTLLSRPADSMDAGVYLGRFSSRTPVSPTSQRVSDSRSQM